MNGRSIQLIQRTRQYTLTRRMGVKADHLENMMRRILNLMTMALLFTVALCISPLPTSASPAITTSQTTTARWLYTGRTINNDHHRSRDDITSSSSVQQAPTKTIIHIEQDDMHHLRRRPQQQQQRKLPGNEMMGDFDLMSAEAGFMVGFVFLIVLLFLCLCCCCCRRRPYGYNNQGGGGSNCLWDLVAIVCLWEMCCDNDGIMGDGFMRF